MVYHRTVAPRYRSTCYAMIMVKKNYQNMIRDFLVKKCDVDNDAVVKDMHLTIYSSHFNLPDYCCGEWPIKLQSNVDETRLMVMTLGGENPIAGRDISYHKWGLRLTKRNVAISEIIWLRREVYMLEILSGPKQERLTTDWRNSSGIHFQPHITLVRRGYVTRTPLRSIGHLLRSNFEWVEFDKLRIVSGEVDSTLSFHMGISGVNSWMAGNNILESVGW